MLPLEKEPLAGDTYKPQILSCVTPDGVKLIWLTIILGFTPQAMMCHPKRGWIENDYSDTIMPHIHEKYVVNMYHYIIS